MNHTTIQCATMEKASWLQQPLALSVTSSQSIRFNSFACTDQRHRRSPPKCKPQSYRGLACMHFSMYRFARLDDANPLR